jgi:hypothetical protein
MKTLAIITVLSILLLGTVASRGANLARMSAETGVPVATLQAERASTGLGWGGIEKAHLLANASGRSFDEIVALKQGGQGWGQIAHANGLNLGKVVSGAHRSSQATTHAKNSQMVHGKKATTGHGKSAMNRGHTAKLNASRGLGHRSSFRSGHMGFHNARGMSGMGQGMGHGGMGHGMGHGGMGHGGHGR